MKIIVDYEYKYPDLVGMTTDAERRAHEIRQAQYAINKRWHEYIDYSTFLFGMAAGAIVFYLITHI